MEKETKTESKKVLWKKSNNNWNVDSYIDSHQEYKQTDKNQKYNIWPTILILADELGFDEETLERFFKEKPTYYMSDLIFAMYLCRLYGPTPAEEFLARTKTVNLGEVHNILKTQEALIQGLDLQDESEEEQTDKSENGNAGNKQLQECINQFVSIIKQHEETRKKYEEVVARLTEVTEKAQVVNSDQKTTEQINENAAPVGTKADTGTALWKRTVKLEKENAVLKVQLESLQREYKLKQQSQETVKNMQIRRLKEQMDIYLNDLEVLRYEKQNIEQKMFMMQQNMSRSKGFFRRRKQVEEKAELEFDERQKLVLKVLGSKEYPDYLKEFMKEAYHGGMSLEQMKAFDAPGLDIHNFEMMKGVLQ